MTLPSIRSPKVLISVVGTIGAVLGSGVTAAAQYGIARVNAGAETAKAANESDHAFHAVLRENVELRQALQEKDIAAASKRLDNLEEWQVVVNRQLREESTERRKEYQTIREEQAGVREQLRAMNETLRMLVEKQR